MTRARAYATSFVIWAQLAMMFFYVRWHGHFREFELFKHWDWPQWVQISKLLKVGLPIGTGIFVAELANHIVV